MTRKNRKQKAKEYDEKYSHIPRDYYERLNWMVDYYNLSEKKMDEIIKKKEYMLDNLYYKDLFIILYEIPEPSPRPRSRIINRKIIFENAVINKQFVHVYSLNAKEDNVYMKRLMENDLNTDELIYTPCIMEVDLFIPTPKAFSKDDTFLSEIGIIRPIGRQGDWDNYGKKYSDMYNENIWIDDSLVITGTVSKFYSVLPRVEIKIKYLNQLYNKYQYNSISKRIKDENKEIKYIKYK